MNFYHGSERNRGISFINRQQMEPSKGNQHWLGDGVYFYKDMNFAYRWIWNMYKTRYGKEPGNLELLQKYIILVADIIIEEGRVFDLTNDPEMFLAFDEVRSDIINKMKSFSKDNEVEKITDGVVLNIMFSEYGLDEMYDAVLYDFATKNTDSSRLDIREFQLCVKNVNVIRNIQECSDYFAEKNTKFIYTYNAYKKRRYHDDLTRKSESYKKIYKRNGNG